MANGERAAGRQRKFRADSPDMTGEEIECRRKMLTWKVKS